MCKSDQSHLQFDLKTPIPNPHHLHCGICRANFEDYKAHLKQKEHLTNVSLQKGFYDIIDNEILSRNKEKRWKTSPIVKVPKSKIKKEKSEKNNDYDSISYQKLSTMDATCPTNNNAQNNSNEEDIEDVKMQVPKDCHTLDEVTDQLM